ncbi:MAG: transglutaminase domain-containing protein [Rubripirellula sp.]|nr:transglutaminase domain-containing protein [Rubripirellula sp.]
MQVWSRKKIETVALAILGIVSVLPLRYFVESQVWFLGEMGSLLVVSATAAWVLSLGDRWSKAKHFSIFALLVLVLLPTLFGLVARGFGSPIAFEMSALSTFGAFSLAIAVVATTNRTRAASLITSGFLVLFCASISDASYAIVFPVAWMLLCVWHLVANHWERLELAMPASVQRSHGLRPSVALLTLLVLVIGAYAVSGRGLKSERLLFGFMPTSGGSVWSDPAARGGVGTGDAAIAAKDHAEAFGAVDSDVFLESTDTSLFDMANDMIGEPMKKSIWEKRQAIGNKTAISMHERAAKSEQGGGAFSTERMPPKKHLHLNDAREPAVVQWDGPTGIRLAMQRYDTFDGSDWSQSKDPKNETLVRGDIGGAPWFFEPSLRQFLTHQPDAVSVGLLKVIRLDSQRIPTPMMSVGIHVKEVERQDFFGIAEDGSYFMPGRDRVPSLTVVHVASMQITEDEIRDRLVTRPEIGISGFDQIDESTASMLQDLILTTADQDKTPADQLAGCVEKLRSEFIFARDGEAASSSLNEFLTSRSGGDHLFATTVALLARKLGLPSRLAAGFYVRPDAFDMAAGHASVLPRDIHVWTEVQLDDDRWIEIEPTPGYLQPVYRPSLWLVARRWAAASWPFLIGGIMAFGSVYLTRRVWIDWLLTLSWSFSGWLPPRRRIQLAIRIIETRARLAGQARPVGKTQRAWLEQLTIADATISGAAARFCDAADALCFGNGEDVATSNATGLVGSLQIRTINQMTQESTS